MADSGCPPRRPPLIELLPGAGRLMQRTIEQQSLTRQLQFYLDLEPSLGAVNQRLAAYLPAAITRPYTRETVYACALREAASAPVGEGDARLDGYLTALLGKATLVLRYNLIGDQGRWDPLYDPPLMVWLRTNPPPDSPGRSDVPWTPLPVNTFINGLFDRLVPNGMLPRPRAIREYA